MFKNYRPLNLHFYMAHLLFGYKMSVFSIDGNKKNEIKKRRRGEEEKEEKEKQCSEGNMIKQDEPRS